MPVQALPAILLRLTCRPIGTVGGRLTDLRLTTYKLTTPQHIAIHQPNYLPWLGFFYKIYACDQFVLLDDVAFSKGGPTARTPYRKQVGLTAKSYLTVPLQKFSLATPINALLIDHTQAWPIRHLQQLENTYRKAPYFTTYYPIISAWMENAVDHTYLADWNIYLIRELCALLGLEPQWQRSSQLPVSGKSTAYLIQLIHYLDGRVYLSGRGAKKYQDPHTFASAGVELHYNDCYTYLEQTRYQQAQGPWLNGLSMVDALLNIGPVGILTLFKDYQSWVERHT